MVPYLNPHTHLPRRPPMIDRHLHQKRVSALSSRRSPHQCQHYSVPPRRGISSLPIGARIEVSAVSFRIVRKLGTLISQGAGGSALIVDYGTDHAVGNSFRVRPLIISYCYYFMRPTRRTRRLLRAMRSRTHLTALARQISLQTSTLRTLPRRWRELVRHAPLSTQPVRLN